MKGVILAAGYGTRFLPVTKTIPKEMLPLINKPAIDFIIEEFLASGMEDILVITSRRKKALEDYLDREMEMEYIFEKENARDKLKNISPPRARFFFIRQQEMLGTGAPEGFLETMLKYASTIPELKTVIRTFQLENDLT